MFELYPVDSITQRHLPHPGEIVRHPLCLQPAADQQNTGRRYIGEISFHVCVVRFYVNEQANVAVLNMTRFSLVLTVAGQKRRRLTGYK